MADVRQARLDRASLEAEGAPAAVLSAADEAIRCYIAGLPVPEWARARLIRHAANRQRQNRWGK